MNIWLPLQFAGRLPNKVRRVVFHGTRLGAAVLSVVGLFAVGAVLALWLQPQWRATLAGRVMPIVVTAAQSSPSMTRLFGVQAVNTAPAPYISTAAANAAAAAAAATTETETDLADAAPFDLRTLPPVAQRVISSRVVAEARDQRVLSSLSEQQRVAGFIARRYHVAEAPIDTLVQAAFDTGHEVGLDPLLLLAVVAIESGFNPYAESGVGAQGLMQVMSDVHQDKFGYFGGRDGALEPLTNMKVGALILKEYIARSGSLLGGLKMYVGAATADDGGYGAKVVAERARLRAAASGGRTPAATPQTPPVLTAASKPAAPRVTPAKPSVAATAVDASDSHDPAPKTPLTQVSSIGT